MLSTDMLSQRFCLIREMITHYVWCAKLQQRNCDISLLLFWFVQNSIQQVIGLLSWQPLICRRKILGDIRRPLPSTNFHNCSVRQKKMSWSSGELESLLKFSLKQQPSSKSLEYTSSSFDGNNQWHFDSHPSQSTLISRQFRHPGDVCPVSVDETSCSSLWTLMLTSSKIKILLKVSKASVFSLSAMWSAFSWSCQLDLLQAACCLYAWQITHSDPGREHNRECMWRTVWGL